MNHSLNGFLQASFVLKKEGVERRQLGGQEPDGPSHPINVVWGEITQQGIMCHVFVMGQPDTVKSVGVIDGK